MVIKKGLKESGNTQIIDLGSGGGGGLIWLNSELKKNTPDLKILLTDYYPNTSAFEHTKKQSANFDYISTIKEMHELVESLDKHENFNWEIDKVKSGPGVVLYLLGTCKNSF